MFEQQNPGQKYMLLLAQGINFVDLAGAEFIENEAKRRIKMGGKLFLYHVKEGVCRELRKDDALLEIGEENIFDSKEVAINTIVDEYLDPSVCAQCEKRIFNECKNKPHPETAGS